MTREEVSKEIGKREFTTGQILSISGRILFENLGIWLLFSLFIFLPAGIFLQVLSMQIPTDELAKMLQEGNLDFVSHPEVLKPILIVNGAQILLLIFYVFTNIAACLFTDKWLQASAELPAVRSLASDSLKKWPQGMLITFFYILGIVASLLIAALLATFGFFMMLLLAVGIFAAYWTFLYHYAVAAASTRPYNGMSAFRYARSIVRLRSGRAIGLMFTCVLINMLFSLILDRLTSSFYILASRPALICVIAGILSVIANLPNFLISISATVFLVNQEQVAIERTKAMNEGYPFPADQEPEDPWADPDDFTKKP